MHGWLSIVVVCGNFADPAPCWLVPTGRWWHCIVFGFGLLTFFRTQYTAAIYATARQGICDVGFATFTNTAARAFCGKDANPATGVQACKEFDPATTWQNATAADACCCDFAYPLIISNLASVVLYETNKIDAQSAISAEIVIDMMNILVWISLVTVIVAHAVWVIEKTNPDKNPFGRDYITGSFDAVWDVSNGFASVKTTCSRLLGLVFQYFNMALFGLLAGTISSVLTSAAQQTAVYKVRKHL